MSEVSELFDRDPLKLTIEERGQIIARMREAQAQFELGVKTPVAERPKKSKATNKLLKDLGLDGGEST